MIVLYFFGGIIFLASLVLVSVWREAVKISNGKNP
jgi:hypothetical protein